MSDTGGVTILAMPKRFRGHVGTIQRNAIASWTKLQPRPEIILFGHEEGAAECAREFGLIHIPEVARNRYGTPLLAGIFADGERCAGHDLLAYVNADIILPAEFIKGVEKVRLTFPKFLAVGRRTNLEVREPLDFSEGWGEKLKERMRREGSLESHTAIDCFVFRRGTYVEVPPLAIGRVWFDQWCIKYARKRGLPVIDLTNFVHMVHQLHDYGHVAGGRQWVYGGAEAEENLDYYGERPHTYTILSATHVMTEGGSIRRVFWRREAAEVKRFLWEVFVHKTLGLRRRLGLSRRERV
ncbi:MAG TPA: hypothetical protein VNH65_08365 [Candidatus Acidoferrum sp.]|nr:hypothetical protein [Candidatus Acidoferrum sp.]